MSYDLKSNIKDHTLGTKKVNKMIERKEVSRQAVPLIDWKAIENASKLQTTGDKLWIAKFVSGFIVNAVQMTYRHQQKKSETDEQYHNDFRRWKSDLCPICKNERENQHHIMCRGARNMRRYRKKTIKSLSQWLEQNGTDPILSEMILLVLYQDGNISFYKTAKMITDNEEYYRLALDQDCIGYQNFIMGRISFRWKKYQAALRLEFQQDNRFSADAWTKHLVYQLYR